MTTLFLLKNTTWTRRLCPSVLEQDTKAPVAPDAASSGGDGGKQCEALRVPAVEKGHTSDNFLSLSKNWSSEL